VKKDLFDYEKAAVGLNTRIAELVSAIDAGEIRISSSNDYDRFVLMGTNRILDKANVAALKLSFLLGYILNPIIINEKWEIIDGQHRYIAAKQLGIPVFYIQIPGLTIEDCARLNQKQRNWSERDFVHCYAEQGNEDYKRLERCVNNYGCSLRTPLYIAGRSNNGANRINAIKHGTLHFTEQDEANFVRKFPMICELAEALAAQRTDIFVLAASKIIDNPGYDHKKMLDCASNCGRDMFKKHADVKSTLEEFSDIYNFRKRRESRVYFEDILRRKGA